MRLPYSIPLFLTAIAGLWPDAACVAQAVSEASGRSPRGKTAVDFARVIRPLLSDRCFRCHGPDAAARQADLRLDVRRQAVAQRDGGPVIIARQPRQSRLLQRVRSADPEQRMPPPDSGLSLSDDEIQSLERWIAQGAEYATHWSFAPITSPTVPVVDEIAGQHSRNPIDAFVRGRLHAVGRGPAVPADRETLLRRVTLDLTGLPPTPDEVVDFLSDDRPDAYQRLLDRLLASPRFGEHQAVPWLQAARYADTNGYQHDFYRTVYPWRTWVIRALNANQPFDQFVIEQLAGDLLPDATPEQVLATCFLRLHRLNSEGGTIDEEFYVENVVDRIETVSTAMLGITIGCARCHDHKFDPFSMRDFYSLFAYFNNGQDKGVDPGGLHARP